MVSSSSPPPAPFSFNCTICFESFHPESCYPVVLPCGHTFVCHNCATRLERCMECRTSLFVPPPPPPPPMTTSPTNAQRSIQNRNRYRHLPDPVNRPKPRPKVEKVRLPLPKNLLLLTLMETAEREARHKREHQDDDDGGSCPSENENKKIWSGIRLHLDSSCGTYEVIDKEGLFIFSSNPTNTGLRLRETKSFLRTSASDLTVMMSNTSDSSDKLNFRDKVQVAHAEDGKVTLARGRGFLCASSSQLVKVGSPLDEACQIEGMLIHLSLRKKELSEEMMDSCEVELGLKRDLKDALLDGVADTTIIRSVPISFQDDTPILVHKSTTPKIGNEGHAQNLLDRSMVMSSQSYEPSMPPLEITSILQSSPHAMLRDNASFNMTSPNSVALSSLSPRERIRFSENEGYKTSTLEALFGCGVSRDSLLGYMDDDSGDFTLQTQGESIEVENSVSELLSTVPIIASPSSASRSHPTSPNALARSPMEQKVNFRTGMSGHRAMGTSSKRFGRLQEYNSASRDGILLMSEHNGISLSPSLNLPSMSFPSVSIPSVSMPPVNIPSMPSMPSMSF